MDQKYLLEQIPSDAPETIIGDDAIIRSGTVLYRGSKIGKSFKTGHNALIREYCIIGDHVSVGSFCNIEHSVEIGDGVRLHSGCFVPEYTLIEAGAWLGPRVTLTNSKFPNRVDSKFNLRGVKICEGAIIGANVTILPGIVIGMNAMVGAGSVVTKDVPADSLVFGNPAVAR